MINFQNISCNNWKNIKISILGAAKSGISAAKLGLYVGAKVFISEKRELVEVGPDLSNFNCEFGGHTNAVLDSDIIIKSPGIPNNISILDQVKHKKIPIISEIEFASWFTTSPILALTGSNGKSTTINLLHEMCLNDGRTSLLGGNIGIPFSENVLWELKNNINNAMHVLELSIFLQLAILEALMCP